MSLGLAAIGGFANRRKEVIDAQRTRQAKREDLKEEIGLRADASTKSQIAVTQAKLDAEAGLLKKHIDAFAARYKHDNPNLNASIADIAIQLGVTVHNQQQLFALHKAHLKGNLKITDRGISITAAPTSVPQIGSKAQVEQVKTHLSNTDNISTIIKGIATQKGMSEEEAKDLWDSMDTATHGVIQRKFLDKLFNQSKNEQPSLMTGGDAAFNFGKEIGANLDYSKESSRLSTWGITDKFRDAKYTHPTSATASSGRMPNRPEATTVRADGNSTNSAVYAVPKIGEIVTPPGGVPSVWTNATRDNRLDNPKNWADPDTRKPRA